MLARPWVSSDGTAEYMLILSMLAQERSKSSGHSLDFYKSTYIRILQIPIRLQNAKPPI